MIGIQNDGSNISIGGESSNSATILVDEQPRKQPKVVVNGVAITVTEPETHCGTYKKAYAIWGVGVAVSWVLSVAIGTPIGVELEAPEIGAGIAVGMYACGTLISSFAAAKAAHKISQERGSDNTFAREIVDFAEGTRRSIKAAI